MTRLEELFCSIDMAKAVLSACDVGRSEVSAFFYDWQTLISGAAAVIAAIVTVYLLRRQIFLQQSQADLQKQHTEGEHRRKVKAALIGIPHALVEINAYLVGCFEAWKAEKPDERPKPPSSAMKVIMDAAAYVDEESFESMRQLIINSQTFESRMATPGRQRPINVLDTMIVDLATLYYLTNRLFKFGRMDSDAPTVPYKKPTRADLEEVLNRDFDLKLRMPGDPLRARVDRALQMTFPH